MDPMSMVRAIEGSICSSCGDNVTEPPLEECDWGAGNSYEPNSCRPGCRLPFCGDGVTDADVDAACTGTNDGTGASAGLSGPDPDVVTDNTPLV